MYLVTINNSLSKLTNVFKIIYIKTETKPCHISDN